MNYVRSRAAARASLIALAALSACSLSADDDIQLITLAPGHFHATLFQKEMLPGVSPRVHVYATLGPTLLS